MEAYVGLDVHSKRRVFVIEAADGRVAHAATSRPRAARADMRIPSTTLSATTSVPGLQTAPPSSTPLPLRNVTPDTRGDIPAPAGSTSSTRSCSTGAKMRRGGTYDRRARTRTDQLKVVGDVEVTRQPGVLIGRARQARRPHRPRPPIDKCQPARPPRSARCRPHRHRPPCRYWRRGSPRAACSCPRSRGCRPWLEPRVSAPIGKSERSRLGGRSAPRWSFDVRVRWSGGDNPAMLGDGCRGSSNLSGTGQAASLRPRRGTVSSSRACRSTRGCGLPRCCDGGRTASMLRTSVRPLHVIGLAELVRNKQAAGRHKNSMTSSIYSRCSRAAPIEPCDSARSCRRELRDYREYNVGSLTL
jgi:hypothetical protein